MTDKQTKRVFDKWKMKSIPIERIVPNPKNPRVVLRPSMPLYEKLKASVSRFDYIDPIIWNERTGMIISGHQRFQVLKDIAEEKGEKITSVPVIAVDFPEDEQDALTIALNKITGLWDQEKLAAMFAEMDEDLKAVTGFEENEIELLFANDDMDLGSDDDMGLDSDPVPKKKREVTCPHCGKTFEV